MKAVERMSPKLSTCDSACRGFWRADNMVMVDYAQSGNGELKLELGVEEYVPGDSQGRPKGISSAFAC